jgi:bacteriochlorophyllide a dehydrogenase
MQTLAVVFESPRHLSLSSLALAEPTADDVVVEIEWSGISTGTERLLYEGKMPPFPGMGYPLVPGYEAVGRIAEAGPQSGFSAGDKVFVPGARCFKDVKGLFGGAAHRLVTSGSRVTLIAPDSGEEAVLLALAATACHAISSGDGVLPELIVGHGVLGRLAARLVIALGGEPPTVWETQPGRRAGGVDYHVMHPDEDPRRDYRLVLDASGDSGILDLLIRRLAKGGAIVLAGFYHEALSFAFPPAFMREARFRVAAEWQPEDMRKVLALIAEGRLSLSGLATHRAASADAERAYQQAFGDADCLKMVLDWKGSA